jgi:hypothetical protein
LGGLMMMTPRRSSGCGACIPELTTRIFCSRLLSSDDTYRKQIFPHLRRITTRPAVPDYKSFHSCR